jgi:hypothetical protein
MANLVSVEAGNIIGASLGVSTYTAFNTTGGLGHLKLISGTSGTNTSNSTATTAGTEVTGGSYAQFSIPASGAFWPTGTPSTGSLTNSGGVATFTGMPAISVYGIEIWDNTGTPVRKWFGSLIASKTLGAGDTITFPASSISPSLS